MNIRRAIVEYRSFVCRFRATKAIVSFEKDTRLNVYCDYAFVHKICDKMFHNEFCFDELIDIFECYVLEIGIFVLSSLIQSDILL